MKTCTKCGETKPVSEFNRDRNKYRSFCKSCKQLQDRLHYEANKQRIIKRCKEYQRINKAFHNAYKAEKRALKLNATPNWLNKQQKLAIKLEYQLASWCSKVMQMEYHVDHIIPLKGLNVCGLHVPWNLQVIPAKDNIKKGNRCEY